MKEKEESFLAAVLSFFSKWNYSYDSYHDEDTFCIDVTMDSLDDCATHEDEIWSNLEELSKEWGAGVDSSGNKFYLGIKAEDEDEDEDEDLP